MLHYLPFRSFKQVVLGDPSQLDGLVVFLMPEEVYDSLIGNGESSICFPASLQEKAKVTIDFYSS
jgi:hypothetical protein